jgi:hypothetical protein
MADVTQGLHGWHASAGVTFTQEQTARALTISGYIVIALIVQFGSEHTF